MLLRAGRADARTREPLIQPSEIRSENGVLKATITAAPGRVQLGDFAFPGFLYNGAYVPPLLRLRLGDTRRITFANDLPDDPSNLHHHGMSVSPQGNSDNVFVHVYPGQQFEYEVRIPTTGHQGPGFFWYHPHAHGFVEKQIRGGMSGGLVVRGRRARSLCRQYAVLGDERGSAACGGRPNPLHGVIGTGAGTDRFVAPALFTGKGMKIMTKVLCALYPDPRTG